MDDKFKFPDEIEDKKVEIEIEGDEVDIEIVDDTPERDRGRQPLNREVEDPTDDEIESYSDKVKNRIKELTHARHDERRRADAVERERQELERLAQQLIDENKSLKKSVNNRPGTDGSHRHRSLCRRSAGHTATFTRYFPAGRRFSAPAPPS